MTSGPNVMLGVTEAWMTPNGSELSGADMLKKTTARKLLGTVAATVQCIFIWKVSSNQSYAIRSGP